ncbi:MAG TPA: hypothetical protein DCE41_29495 [Cytophagales bacterium]|nr:hypothetical protein [Cytophagales bacterium]
MTNLNELRLPMLAELERERNSKVLVLAASMLDSEFLPQLYEVLLEIGKTERLDVVLYGRGGEINAARRIGLLLHEFTKHLSFVVPYHCQSACTALALAGHEVIASDLASFSPIDPRLQTVDGDGPNSIHEMDSESVRLFNEMCKAWFHLDIQQEEIRMQLLASVGSSIFPTTLTALYRANLEMKDISEELLAFQLPQETAQRRSEIVHQLMHGYHSHSYAITRANLEQMGLRVKRDEKVEALAWQVGKALTNFIGGQVRQTPQDPKNDVLLATASMGHVRQRHLERIAHTWLEIKL